MLHASAFVRLLNCGFNWNARQPVLCHSSYGYDPQYICLARSSLSELILPRSSECQSSNGGSAARVEGIPSRPILISSSCLRFSGPMCALRELRFVCYAFVCVFGHTSICVPCRAYYTYCQGQGRIRRICNLLTWACVWVSLSSLCLLNCGEGGSFLNNAK